jgi:hypothetical protein
MKLQQFFEHGWVLERARIMGAWGDPVPAETTTAIHGRLFHNSRHDSHAGRRILALRAAMPTADGVSPPAPQAASRERLHDGGSAGTARR